MSTLNTFLILGICLFASEVSSISFTYQEGGTCDNKIYPINLTYSTRQQSDHLLLVSGNASLPMDIDKSNEVLLEIFIHNQYMKSFMLVLNTTKNFCSLTKYSSLLNTITEADVPSLNCPISKGYYYYKDIPINLDELDIISRGLLKVVAHLRNGVNNKDLICLYFVAKVF